MLADTFDAALVKALPPLRKIALRLTQNAAVADDLVQDTLLRALANRNQFASGTNVGAWLYTILRNTYFSQWKKEKRCIYDGGDAALDLSVDASQHSHVELYDALVAVRKLSPKFQEALWLIACGETYEDAARELGISTGTLKSRVFRAKEKLRGLLDA